MKDEIKEKKKELAHYQRKMERKIQEMCFCSEEGFSTRERLREMKKLQQDIVGLEQDIFFLIEQSNVTFLQRFWTRIQLLKYELF